MDLLRCIVVIGLGLCIDIVVASDWCLCYYFTFCLCGFNSRLVVLHFVWRWLLIKVVTWFWFVFCWFTWLVVCNLLLKLWFGFGCVYLVGWFWLFMIVIRVLFECGAVAMLSGLRLVIMFVVFDLLYYLFWFILVFCCLFGFMCLLLCVCLVWLLFSSDDLDG